MNRDFSELHTAAYDVADLFRAGGLEHLRAKEWSETWTNLVSELKSRCPGFHEDQYSQALNQGFFESR